MGRKRMYRRLVATIGAGVLGMVLLAPGAPATHLLFDPDHRVVVTNPDSPSQDRVAESRCTTHQIGSTSCIGGLDPIGWSA